MESEFSDTTYPDIMGIIAVLADPPKPSTISGIIFSDTGNNGTYDTDESGMPDITIPIDALKIFIN
ncbi:MAG: hypothetical protein OXC46_07100 [Thaumarchaeota archaeon]|nr:hypothetical protein [Nitrososphaerota archaeon]